MNTQVLGPAGPIVRPRSRTTPQVYRFILCLLILSSTFDKAGLVLGLAGRSISISIYKLLFPLLLLPLIAERTVRFSARPRDLDSRLLRIVSIFVVVQTIASILGGLSTPGDFPLMSEIYYFVQRSSLLFIPLFAVRARLNSSTVIRLFLAAVMLHYGALAFQFAAPSGYLAVVRQLQEIAPAQGIGELDNSTSIRPDNTFGWDGKSLAFIGLQRTSNFGVFIAAFGLLALVVPGRTLPRRIFRVVASASAILIAVFGGSRAVFILTCVALLVMTIRNRLGGTGATAATKLMSVAAIAILISGLVVVASDSGILDSQMFSSVGAFTDPTREGSNAGKLAIMDYGIALFRESPLVGYGARKFSDISAAVGNTSRSTSEAHSQFLATLLSSGLVGLGAYCIMLFSVSVALLKGSGQEGASIAGLFIGLAVYNIIYDAGALDAFACFNGVAVYYALTRDAECQNRPVTAASRRSLVVPGLAS